MTRRGATVGPPLILKLADWPARDRALWEEGTRRRGQFDKRRHVDRIEPITVVGTAKGFGRLLGALSAEGILDHTVGPAERVTPRILNRFVDTMQAMGNKRHTIEVRLFEIRCAMKIMVPEVDTAWIVRPGGHSLDDWFEQEPRRRELKDMRELHAWGLAMTDAAAPGLPRFSACVAFRNGVILALLATCAPRLGSLVAMHDGIHLVAEPDGTYRVMFRERDTKNRGVVDYVLPEPLSAVLQTYRTRVRPVLMGEARHDILWVGREGRPLREAGLSQMVRRAMFRQFGKEEGPHYFRHVVASAIAEFLPARRGLAAAVLGHSLAVSDGVYTQLDARAAARRFSAQTRQDRERTRLHAARLFKGIR